MVNKSVTSDLSEKIRIGLEKARLKFLEEEVKNNGVVIISDKEGYIKKVPAKDLLPPTQKSTK